MLWKNVAAAGATRPIIHSTMPGTDKACGAAQSAPAVSARYDRSLSSRSRSEMPGADVVVVLCQSLNHVLRSTYISVLYGYEVLCIHGQRLVASPLPCYVFLYAMSETHT